MPRRVDIPSRLHNTDTLAGDNQGARLQLLPESISKALVPVDGRAFVEYQIELFRSHGIRDPIIVGRAGHLIEENLGDELPGTAGVVKNVGPLLADAVLLNGNEDRPESQASSCRGTTPRLLYLPPGQELKVRGPNHCEQLRI
jgi:NDP-sugar pyrophosphorylase family protein